MSSILHQISPASNKLRLPKLNQTNSKNSINWQKTQNSMKMDKYKPRYFSIDTEIIDLDKIKFRNESKRRIILNHDIFDKPNDLTKRNSFVIRKLSEMRPDSNFNIDLPKSQ